MFGGTSNSGNIKDLLHFTFSDFEPLWNVHSSNSSRSSFFKFKHKIRLKLFLEKAVYGTSAIKDQNEKLSDKVWAIVSSVNNLNSLAFLEGSIASLTFVTTNSLKKTKGLEQFPSLSWHKALNHKTAFDSICDELIKPTQQREEEIKNRIYEATGMLEAAIEILQEGQPKALIFTNDHTLKNRSLAQAAIHLGIPTIYLQHASVSAYFPPLIFDLNLLEGEDAHEKYKLCGPIRGEVQLVGMPKFDAYAAQRKSIQQIDKIAVCANITDDKDKIESLVHFLTEQYAEASIYFRPHPRDQRTFNLGKDVQLSDSKTENVFELLKKVDLIVAGHTSTHLEATLLNVYSIYFKLGDVNFGDYYGYLEHGLVPESKDLNELKGYIDNRLETKDPYQKAKRYNATIDTTDEGKSGDLAVKAIQLFLKE